MTADTSAAEPDDIEVEINLQPVPLAASRLVVLSAVCRRGFLELDTAASADDPEGERFDLAAWLTEEGLDPFVSARERRILNRRIGKLDPDDAEYAIWQIEATAALAWSLERLDEPPPIDQSIDPALLLEALPAPWDRTQPLRLNAELLPEEMIAFERERAELWHWRAEVEIERVSATGRAATELTSAIKEVANEAAAAGFFPEPAGNDFPVEGRPYRSASASTQESLALIATERLRAFNWLCGLAQDWDAEPAAG